MNKGRWNLNKSQRMQIKALACILGLVLIVILLVGRLVFSLLDREEPEVHIPVVTTLQNVWIMEVGEQELMVFQDGEAKVYPYGMAAAGNGEALEEQGKEVQDTKEMRSGGQEQTRIPYQAPKESREQVADITLTDGAVTQVTVKSEKVSGKVLSAGPEAVELEGVGRIPVSEQAKGYRLYDSLSMCTVSDVLIGYDFNDFVLDNGEICAVLMVKEEAMEYIRVLLKSADFASRFHESVTLTCDTEYTIYYGEYDNLAQEVHKAGEFCTIDRNSTYFQSDRITIVPSALTGRITLSNVTRSQGEPSYRGKLELLRTQEGLAVVNEVLLEEYLYCVVPSEMPASYPAEALKAQAVCARTYAYSHMMKAAYPEYGAHVDDSTSYQVYNNILEQEATTTAVKDTYGQLLYTGDSRLAGTYYYSTSCGLGSDSGVWRSGGSEDLSYIKARAINRSTMDRLLAAGQGQDSGAGQNAAAGQDNGAGQSEAAGQDNGAGHSEAAGQDNGVMQNGGQSQAAAAGVMSDLDMVGQAMTDEETFAAFIKGKSADDFEVSEGWYRWTYSVPEIDTAHMLEAVQKRYEANEKLVLTLDSKGEYVSKPVTELGRIRDLYIAHRGPGGIADELHIVTDKQTIKVITEHNIRYVLNDGKAKILRQDGSEIASPNLLPSAFFTLDAGKEKENVVGYTLTGGGYGHGVGMSQNGARAMAKEGYTSENILKFFYEGCSLRNVYN